MMERETKPWYKKWWVIAIAAFLLIGLIFGGSEDDEPVPTGSTTTTTAAVVTTTTAPTTTTTTAPTTTTTMAEARMELFTVELFVVEDQCFGSAGALVTVEPDLTYNGIYPGGEYLLIYEISGTEDGTQTYNLDVHDDSSYSFNQEIISTASCEHNLETEVVGLRKR